MEILTKGNDDFTYPSSEQIITFFTAEVSEFAELTKFVNECIREMYEETVEDLSENYSKDFPFEKYQAQFPLKNVDREVFNEKFTDYTSGLKENPINLQNKIFIEGIIAPVNWNCVFFAAKFSTEYLGLLWETSA